MIYKMITRQVFIEITLCKAKNSRRIVLLIGEKHDKEKTFLKLMMMRLIHIVFKDHWKSGDYKKETEKSLKGGGPFTNGLD